MNTDLAWRDVAGRLLSLSEESECELAFEDTDTFTVRKLPLDGPYPAERGEPFTLRFDVVSDAVVVDGTRVPFTATDSDGHDIEVSSRITSVSEMDVQYTHPFGTLLNPEKLDYHKLGLLTAASFPDDV